MLLSTNRDTLAKANKLQKYAKPAGKSVRPTVCKANRRQASGQAGKEVFQYPALSPSLGSENLKWQRRKYWERPNAAVSLLVRKCITSCRAHFCGNDRLIIPLASFPHLFISLSLPPPLFLFLILLHV